MELDLVWKFHPSVAFTTSKAPSCKLHLVTPNNGQHQQTLKLLRVTRSLAKGAMSPICSYWTKRNNFKMLFISSKNSIRFRDIHFFIFSSFPLSTPVGHYRRNWLKIKFNIHDATMRLNKNLKTNIVGYVGK